MNIIGLFASPVVSDFYACTEEEYNYLDNVEMFGEWDSGYGNKSKDTFILHNPMLKNLSEFILKTSETMLTDILGYHAEGVQFTQSWVSHKNPGEFHQRHSHANSIISGVYYFQKNIDKLPPITFYKTKSVDVFEIQVPYQKENSQRPFSWDRYTYTPACGNLILFPSYMQHAVGVNESDSIRKSLAFNVIPQKSFGVLEALTYLPFESLK
jgi:uncharacterized protein (TIGR02466 family)